ncbi:shikimate dehydrogenase [Oikeobacillus pervagus]|uniref:Shikimate dehydrogenase (NADP(+)) n=1 Tax=Oikeobacillus pervagus TaxID=1325931 RepID=A0AAJ1WLX9_9BACI|nr:shikimate dehydrogenase [Oikeobacillus pervagus]MDQ0216721.1 shikimate dehydrogenase [Oikeobacillus pervagus]
MKQLFGVIGDPIAHSMSPAMHNAAFKEAGIDAYYHPFHVKPEDLEEAVKGMKAIGVQGFNVTIPHKTSIIPLLDSIDPLAEAIGAVNTVVRVENRWVGFNTDGEGYVRALKEQCKEYLQNEPILIIGAGGAARGIYCTLAAHKVKQIDLCNRTVEKAQKLANDCPYETVTNVMNLQEAEKRLKDYSIIIQTTSIGMSPKTDESPLKIDELQPNTIVSDIVYNPIQTKFLLKAKQQGAIIQNGMKMFVYQGALAFEKWTGIFPDTHKMEQLVYQQLGGTYVNR